MGKGSGLESLILNSPGLTLLKIPNGVGYAPGGKTFPKKSAPDFVGVSGGRCVIFDAKECGLVNRFPIGNTSNVKPHQKEQLIRFGEEGAISGLLVESTRQRKLYWVPWNELAKNEASIQWEDMQQIGDSTRAVNWEAIIPRKRRSG